MAGQRPNPLYDPRFEHDACGLGFVARTSGAASHELVEQALALLRAMAHRGAVGSDPDTGDGAGLMLQVPDAFLRRVCREEIDVELPPQGDYAVAMAFLPREPDLRLRCEELCVRIAVEEGQRPLGWRDVPVDSDAIGALARESEPIVRQLLIARGRRTEREVFARKLHVIRRRVELAAAARRIGEATFSIVSCSARTLTYKGLLTAEQLDRYYGDLREPDVASALALVHSRFSTNTLGTWDLAHPFMHLAHNGEINTVRGNRSWMHAREPVLRSTLLGDDLQKLFPIIDERWSDSAALDAAFELLVTAGRAPAHALAMLIPPAWERHDEMPDDVRAFHAYHTSLIEPWDGPAAVAFCDGRQVGAVLDRSGLRPARYAITRDGLVVLASEAGALDLDPADVIEAGRLEPGRMLLVDTERHQVLHDAEIKSRLARRRPYRALLEAEEIPFESLPAKPAPPSPSPRRAAPPAARLRLHGRGPARAHRADGRRRRRAGRLDGDRHAAGRPLRAPAAALRLLQAALRAGHEPGHRPAARGALDEPAHGHRPASEPARRDAGARAARARCHNPCWASTTSSACARCPATASAGTTLPIVYDPSGGGRGLERALEDLCRAASRAVADQTRVFVLSDRGIGPDRAPIPSLLAAAAVHSHLVREGNRTRCSLVIESGEPREVMHLALLVGYGVSAVCPYVALETIAEAAGAGRLGDLDAAEAQHRYAAAMSKGLLKVMSKMGISTVQSYRGAQLFEAVGLGAEVVARYFTGHRLARRRHRARPDRRGRGRAPRGRARVAGRRARPRRRLRPAPARRAARLAPRDDRRPAARGARQLLPDLPGLLAGRRRRRGVLGGAAEPLRDRADRPACPG